MATEYPFAAVPSTIIRGGHGPINLHVLAYIIDRGDTFTAIPTMAREIGCSEKSIRKSLRYWDVHAKQYGIIFHQDRRDGRTTIYRVQVLRMDTPGKNDRGTPGKKVRGGMAKTTGVPLAKTTDEEDPNEADPLKQNDSSVPAAEHGTPVNALLERFRPVNPSVDRLFPNRSQRAAVERLYKKLGLEELHRILSVLPALTGERYAPVITTPLQLETKLGQLAAFIAKRQQQKGNIAIIS